MPLPVAADENFNPGSDRDNGDRKSKLESHGKGPWWAKCERNIGHTFVSVKLRRVVSSYMCE